MGGFVAESGEGTGLSELLEKAYAVAEVGSLLKTNFLKCKIGNYKPLHKYEL